MIVVGFAGYSGSGKTTLVEALVRHVVAGGQSASVIKHAHHRFDIDYPGKDTWRHREAGAYEVLAASGSLIALQRREQPPREHTLEELLPMLDVSVDWVFVDGYKQEPIPKIEVWRASTGRSVLYAEDPRIRAIATYSPDALHDVPPACAVLDLNDVPAIAAWLAHNRNALQS